MGDRMEAAKSSCGAGHIPGTKETARGRLVSWLNRDAVPSDLPSHRILYTFWVCQKPVYALYAVIARMVCRQK